MAGNHGWDLGKVVLEPKKRLRNTMYESGAPRRLVSNWDVERVSRFVMRERVSRLRPGRAVEPLDDEQAVKPLDEKKAVEPLETRVRG